MIDQLAKPKEKIQPKNFTTKVQSSEDVIVYRDRIITALYNSGLVREKCKTISSKQKIKLTTNIWEDIEGETWFWLCKQKAELIVELYESNADRILGLAVKIAVMKGVIAHSKNPEYHKHSVARNILFASNLGKHENLSSSGEKEHNNSFSQEILDVDSGDDFQIVWNEIREELESDNVKFMEEYFESEKKRGAYPKETKQKMEALLNNIKEVCEDKGFKNFSR